MTLVVGVNLGEYVLFGADSKHTAISDDVRDHDELEKILQTPTGLASGGGIWNAVSYAINDMIAKGISDHLDVQVYLRNFRNDFLIGARDNPLYATADRTIADMAVNVGAWLLSSIEDGALQVRIYGWLDDFTGQAAPEGMPWVALPPDIQDVNDRASSALVDALRSCRRKRDIDKTLQHNMRSIARYFKHQAQRSRFISKQGIQFGIHERDGSLNVTEIMPVADLV